MNLIQTLNLLGQ